MKERVKFSEQEIQMLHNENLSNKDISGITGRLQSVISIKRSKLGIVRFKRDTVKYTPEQLKVVEDLSISDRVAGEMIGKCRKAIHNKRRTMGLK